MRLRRSGNQQPPTSCQLLPHGRRARPGLRMGSPGEPPGPARPSGEPSNPSYRPRALSRRSFLKATAAASAASANFKNWRRASAPGVSAPTRLGELGLLKPAPVCPGFKSIDSLPLPWPLPIRTAQSARGRGSGRGVSWMHFAGGVERERNGGSAGASAHCSGGEETCKRKSPEENPGGSPGEPFPGPGEVRNPGEFRNPGEVPGPGEGSRTRGGSASRTFPWRVAEAFSRDRLTASFSASVAATVARISEIASACAVRLTRRGASFLAAAASAAAKVLANFPRFKASTPVACHLEKGVAPRADDSSVEGRTLGAERALVHCSGACWRVPEPGLRVPCKSHLNPVRTGGCCPGL
mmetsp:Transcript_14668/g.37208  ORF Transcript_14668/g.37208 Transcript_14668/m.37208 type:complete len:354 (-) Transcript_14668:235-1296(-)